MGRLARVVAADVPHHLTQRGNGRRFILDCDADRAVYLNLLREDVELYRVSVIGYCLMSNHVHLIVVPRTVDGLALALKRTHGIRFLLERSSPIKRACVARTLLFLSLGPTASMGGIALH